MLNYSEFYPIEGSKKAFKFKKLILFDEEQNIYGEVSTKKKYYVTLLSNQNEYNILYALFKNNVFGNILGFMKRKNQFYCFSSCEGYQVLAQFIEKHIGEKELISQLFCLQLIEQTVEAARQISNAGASLKILTPYSVILSEQKGKYKFQLKFPLPHSIFEELSSSVAKKQIQFCAPQILMLMNKEADLASNKFERSILYSLGLILLYCFGYRIKSQERILALKKSKQFKIFLKAIRKEIKLFQEGKFISKIIKILTEENEYVRDNIETFLIKLHSPQLQSLRRFVFKPSKQQEKQAYIPTVYSDYSDQTRKSGLNRTIQIRLSSMSYSQNQRSQLQGDQGSNPNNMSLFATFKKSPQAYKHDEEIQEVEEDNHNDDKIQLPSPIEIHLDWDEQQEQQIRKTPKKQSQRIDLEFEDQDYKISLPINNSNKSKNNQKRLLYSDEKKSNSFTNHLKKSSKSIHDSYKISAQIQPHIEVQSKAQLKNQQFLTSKKQKYHIMIQEEPEIIKYTDNQYKLQPSPTVRKSISKNSNDLQDMTLIIEDEDDEETMEIQEKNGTNYEQIKAQFNKKSQAIFITLLVNFLIYKIIDYFVQ